MLAALTIRDIVLIDRLDIGFGRGLSVVTGETGAGKSILLDSLALALGARGDAGLVRKGADSGEVVAVFNVPLDHAARTILRGNALDDDSDIILRRVQSADGRTRGFINDRPVSAQLMKEVGTALVEIHGQHDDRALIDPAGHRALLDAFGKLEADLEDVREAYRARERAARALAEQEARIAAARRDKDFITHALGELDELKPLPGEEEELAARRAVMMQSEKVVGDLQAAFDTLEGDGALFARVSASLRKLERQAEKAQELLGAPVATLQRALTEAGEARDLIEQAIRKCDFDPAELERQEERLFALRGAARKYSVQVDALAALREKFRGDLDSIETGEGELGKLAKARDAAEAAYLKKAQALSKKRAQEAAHLKKAVEAELAPLKLERARFSTRVDTDEAYASATGIDRVEFHVQTNPGTQEGPLRKVASGGELARFILALKVALADKGSAPTLIFDEIDTAVGGAVADAIGMRLARLAGGVQVLAITHAPQVAARAAHHLRISKAVHGSGAKQVDEITVTQVDALDHASRQEEIARMLSGAEITDEARAQAQRLIAAAG